MAQKFTLGMNDNDLLSMGANALSSGQVTPEEVQDAAGVLGTDTSWLDNHLKGNVDPYTIGGAKAPKKAAAKGEKKENKMVQEKKLAQSRTVNYTPDEFEALTSQAENIPGIREQRKGIDDMENMLNMQFQQGGDTSEAWLRPFIALAEAESGKKLMHGYNPGPNQAQKNQNMIAGMDDLQKRKGDLSKTILDSVTKMKAGTDNNQQNQMLMQQLATMTGLAAGKGAGGPTQGETAVDKAFAKDYVDFIPGGGYAAIQQSLGQMDDIMDKLGTQEGLTGPKVGLLPKAARDLIMPESADLQDRYEQIVQQSLKRILGAQFTEQEAKRLIERSYNPRLDQKTNAKRILGVQQELQEAAKAKAEASRYFERNGYSMRGYGGSTAVTIGGKKFNIDPSGAGGGTETPPPGGKTAGKSPKKKLADMTDAEQIAYEKELMGG